MSDWSSDVCSSDLVDQRQAEALDDDRRRVGDRTVQVEQDRGDRRRAVRLRRGPRGGAGIIQGQYPAFLSVTRRRKPTSVAA